MCTASVYSTFLHSLPRFAREALPKRAELAQQLGVAQLRTTPPGHPARQLCRQLAELAANKPSSRRAFRAMLEQSEGAAA